MAITRAETQVTWSAANSVSVTAGGNQTSDTITLDDTCTAAAITLKADNSTTAAADDIIYFYLRASAGDPDGASTSEFSSTDFLAPIAILDTSEVDPALKTVNIPVVPKTLQLYAEGATAGSTNAITVSATIEEMRTA
jgi:hypothetical protein